MSDIWYSSEGYVQDTLENSDVKELLTLILLELQKMNQHLYSITDEEGE